MKKVVRLFLVGTFVVFSTISLLHSPVNATIVQLTDDDYNYSSPYINNAGSVAWYGQEGGNDTEIFLYESLFSGGGSGGCFIDTLSCE